MRFPLIVVYFPVFCAVALSSTAPAAWELLFPDATNYVCSYDSSTRHSGQRSAAIRYDATGKSKPSGNQSVRQTIKLGALAGKRVKVTASLKTAHAEAAGLVARAGGAAGELLPFHNTAMRGAAAIAGSDPGDVGLEALHDSA